MSRPLTVVAAGVLLVVPLALAAPGQAYFPTGVAAVVAAGAPAAYAETTLCQAAPPRPEDPRLYAEDRGRLPGLLDLDDVHRQVKGTGIGVAVVDTGVAANGRIANLVQGGAATGVRRGVQDTHGTLVAGLIAGTDRDGKAFGVAPAARVVSVKAADAGKEVAASSQEDLAQVTDDRMAEAIRTATSLRATQGVRVINISLNLPEDDDAVTAAIKAATDKGILVVAAVGNRTRNEDDEPDPTWKPGEETVAFPATVEDVLGVTALGAAETFDPNAVWTGSAVDVSAPLDGVISATTNGGTCLVGAGSSFAAAIVSGVAALLFERFPHDSPEQIATRIMATAQGATEDDALDGHGMVQPDEALTAVLDIDARGKLVRGEAYAPQEQRATPPPLPADHSAETRATLLWWGVGAGGVLLAALLLAPLTRRRA
jgi:membrane-anchored mycosin MYCP